MCILSINIQTPHTMLPAACASSRSPAHTWAFFSLGKAARLSEVFAFSLPSGVGVAWPSQRPQPRDQDGLPICWWARPCQACPFVPYTAGPPGNCPGASCFICFLFWGWGFLCFLHGMGILEPADGDPWRLVPPVLLVAKLGGRYLHRGTVIAWFCFFGWFSPVFIMYWLNWGLSSNIYLLTLLS